MPPTTIASRPYVDADLPRLQAALAGWRRRAGLCGYCHVGDLPSRIYEGLRGRRPVGDLVSVWEDGDGIAGIAISARFEVAFDVFASPALRGTDAESAMLQAAYHTTLAQVVAAGRQPRILSDVASCDQVRAQLLRRLGFERYRVWDHLTQRSLRQPIPTPAPPDGITVRPATTADAEQLAAVRNSSFGTDWTEETFRHQVMRKPGYDPGTEMVAATGDGRIAAFAKTWLDQVNKVGHFEPVGTHRDYRRRGLATVILLTAMRRMRDLGMEVATLQHDAANLAAANLYSGIGFEKQYETLGFRRES